MTEQLGVILQGDLISGDGDGQRVRLFVDVDVDGDGPTTLDIRRAYGARNAILTLNLDDVEAALLLLKVEGQRTRAADGGQLDLPLTIDPTT